MFLKIFAQSLEVHRFAFYPDFFFDQVGNQTAVVSQAFSGLLIELKQIVIIVLAALIVTFRSLILKIKLFFVRTAFRQQVL